MTMTIQELLADDQFWNSEVLVSLSGDDVVKEPARTDASQFPKTWRKAIAGIAFASAFVFQSAAGQSEILYRAQEFDLSAAREAPTPGIVERLDASDLHKEAPNLEAMGRFIRKLRPVKSFDDFA